MSPLAGAGPRGEWHWLMTSPCRSGLPWSHSPSSTGPGCGRPLDRGGRGQRPGPTRRGSRASGFALSPSGDRAYSARRVGHGRIRLLTSPSLSSSARVRRSRCGRMPGVRRTSSPKRRGPQKSCQATSGFQGPPSSPSARATGSSSPASEAGFQLSRTAASRPVSPAVRRRETVSITTSFREVRRGASCAPLSPSSAGPGAGAMTGRSGVSWLKVRSVHGLEEGPAKGVVYLSSVIEHARSEERPRGLRRTRRKRQTAVLRVAFRDGVQLLGGVPCSQRERQ